MRIASLTLSSPFILAPLAGYTDLAFRQLCREHGASLCVSEMISCHGLVFQQKNTLDMIRTVPDERPVAFQLFGSDPEIMGEAAAILSSGQIDLIDINMGCPVKKVTRKGAGAALMKNPDLAARIIENVCRHSLVPVTVKTRSGWDHGSISAPEFARMAEEAGAAAVTVHARTWTDGFGGKPDLRVIAMTKQAVSIPVIGNGDIGSYQDGMAMIAETGCDGVMIGRGAIGRPWVFDRNKAFPSLTDRLNALRRHLELLEKYFPLKKILPKTRHHAAGYFKGLPGATALRRTIYGATTYEALQDIISALQAESLVVSSGKNPPALL